MTDDEIKHKVLKYIDVKSTTRIGSTTVFTVDEINKYLEYACDILDVQRLLTVLFLDRALGISKSRITGKQKYYITKIGRQMSGKEFYLDPEKYPGLWSKRFKEERKNNNQRIKDLKTEDNNLIKEANRDVIFPAHNLLKKESIFDYVGDPLVRDLIARQHAKETSVTNQIYVHKEPEAPVESKRQRLEQPKESFFQRQWKEAVNHLPATIIKFILAVLATVLGTFLIIQFGWG